MGWGLEGGRPGGQGMMGGVAPFEGGGGLTGGLKSWWWKAAGWMKFAPPEDGQRVERVWML